jgi:hypothetical protein
MKSEATAKNNHPVSLQFSPCGRGDFFYETSRKSLTPSPIGRMNCSNLTERKDGPKT